MKRITLYFFRGLLTVLPLGLTIYIIYFFIAASEKYVSTLIQPLLGTLYFPGIGLLITIGCIIALGILISQPFLYKIFGLLELPFTNIPVVKNVYTSIKSFAEYFSEDNSKKNNQVVIVTIPNSDINLVGLVTRESIDELGPFDNNMVAVYVPMSYMVGGYTIFIPKKLIRPINMSVEEAMKNSLLAWLTKTDKRRS